MAVANSSFFSLTEEDDLILPSPQHSPVKEPDLGRGASPGITLDDFFIINYPQLTNNRTTLDINYFKRSTISETVLGLNDQRGCKSVPHLRINTSGNYKHHHQASLQTCLMLGNFHIILSKSFQKCLFLWLSSAFFCSVLGPRLDRRQRVGSRRLRWFLVTPVGHLKRATFSDASKIKVR